MPIGDAAILVVIMFFIVVLVVAIGVAIGKFTIYVCDSKRERQLKEPVLAIVGLFLKGNIDVMTACEELMHLKDLTVESLKSILQPRGQYIETLFLVQDQAGTTPKYMIEQLIKVFAEQKSGKVRVKEE